MRAFNSVVALFWGACVRTPLVLVVGEAFSMHGLCLFGQSLALKNGS
jgi:hypothetical protein